MSFETTIRNEDSANSAYVECSNNGSGSISSADGVAVLAQGAGVPGSTVLTEAGAVHLTVKTRIDFTCSNFGTAAADRVSAWYTRASAIPVSQLRRTS